MKSKAMLFLFGVFAGSFVRELSLLIGYADKADYALFAQIGRPELYFVSVGVLLVLDGLAAWFMLRPRIAGLWLAIVSIVVSKIEEAAALRIALDHLELVKRLYAARREARGQTVHPEALEWVASPLALQFGFALTLAGSLLVFAVLWANRHRFAPSRGGEP